MSYSRLGIIVLFGIVLAALGVYLASSESGPIYDFDDKRDSHEIIKIFARDTYWLTVWPDYPVEYMLKYRASGQELKDIGRLKIKVYREKGEFVGFVAYHMEAAQQGILLFIDVNPEFRGGRRGYAEHLLRYALADLKKMGALHVKLCTRTENYPAQGLYRRIGFYETSRDNGFVYFQYDL